MTESAQPKKRGGKRTGAGRRKVLPESAQGQPSGAAPAPRKELATRILESLKIPETEWLKLHPPHPRVGTGEPTPCSCEICLWRFYAKLDRGALEYLWNRADGKPVQHNVVNHLHDKPIDLNVNVKLSEIVRQVRERKREYERNRG